jgi:hypothetical protein
MGFSIPEDRWLRPGTSIRKLFDELVVSDHSRLREWFDPRALRRHVGYFDSRGQGGVRLWLLLILAVWREQNRDISFA